MLAFEYSLRFRDQCNDNASCTMYYVFLVCEMAGWPAGQVCLLAREEPLCGETLTGAWEDP